MVAASIRTNGSAREMASKITRIHFDIEHWPCNKHGNSETLSRWPYIRSECCVAKHNNAPARARDWSTEAFVHSRRQDLIEDLGWLIINQHRRQLSMIQAIWLNRMTERSRLAPKYTEFSEESRLPSSDSYKRRMLSVTNKVEQS